MPKGIINQLSAELNRYIDDNSKIWNNAVNLTDDHGTAECQIEEDFYNRKIKIIARGNNARGLVRTVMDSLKDITDDYRGVHPEIIVPCSCKICVAAVNPTIFLYNKLLKWSVEKESGTVTCNESNEILSIEDLLYRVGLPKPLKQAINSKGEVIKKKMFISYSKYDEDYLQDFVEHLVTLKNQGLTTFNCREIELGAEWDSKIKKEIEDCDIMVCLISVKFLNTDYITYLEVPKAINENKTIIPIIIKACDWEHSQLGKYQAVQRGRIVSLDSNMTLLGKIKSYNEEEKAAFWTAIIKEFRRKLFAYM
jgi:hypothetical protein